MCHFLAKDEKMVKRLKEENEDIRNQLDKLRKTLHKDRISRCTSIDDQISSAASSN